MNEPTSEPIDKPTAPRGLPMGVMVIVVLAVATFAALKLFNPPADDGRDGKAVGHRLPMLSLVPLTGDARPIGPADLAGHVTLIDFWGTWCGPCQEEIPHIAELGAKYRDRSDFLLLPVSCGQEIPENVEMLRRETDLFLRANKLDLNTYADPDGASRLGVDRVAGFQGYPTTVLLDRQGVIRGFWVGYRRGEERQIEQRLVEVLGEGKK